MSKITTFQLLPLFDEHFYIASGFADAPFFLTFHKTIEEEMLLFFINLNVFYKFIFKNTLKTFGQKNIVFYFTSFTLFTLSSKEEKLHVNILLGKQYACGLQSLMILNFLI